MSDRAELAAVLRRLTELLNPDDHDSNDWSGCTSAELRSEIQSFLDDAEAGRPIDEAGRRRLELLFAPTGALQEDSLASGWGEEVHRAVKPLRPGCAAQITQPRRAW